MPTRPSGHAGKSARDDDVTDRRRRKETAWLLRHERIHLNAYAGLESSQCEQARRRRQPIRTLRVRFSFGKPPLIRTFVAYCFVRFVL